MLKLILILHARYLRWLHGKQQQKLFPIFKDPRLKEIGDNQLLHK